MDITPQQFRQQLASMISDVAIINQAVAEYEARWVEPKPKRAEAVAKPQEVLDAEATIDGSKRLLSAIEAARQGRDPKSPRKLIWRHYSGLETSNCTGGNGYLFELKEPPRTTRDPCPRCGARGDFNCGHARVQGGRLVAL